MKTLAALVCAASLLLSREAPGQLDPGDRWRTIETNHFRIHFASGLESEGRRAAVNAERAFSELSTELKPPRGKVDLVVADNVDYVNGYASTFPWNRIVIFAHPPIDSPELRNYEDWSRLVITHELTHIFHGDRADGLWRLGRRVFGRHPALFPNFLLPAWVIEGLAVYYESRITGVGRLEGAEHYMIARSAAEAGRVPRIGELSRASSRFPGGEGVYAYGGLIFDYLSRTRGTDKVPRFVDETSRTIFPLSLNAKAKRAFGISFENAWRDWRDSLVRANRESRGPLPGWIELTRDGRYVDFPRWLGDTAILYTAATGREITSAYIANTSGRITRIGRRNGLDVNAPADDGSIVFAQPDYVDPFHFRNDLYVARNGSITRLTRGSRISQPDVRRDGSIVAVQAVPGSTVLVRSGPDQRRFTQLSSGSTDVQWGEPRWSPDGNSIAAVKVDRGRSTIVVVDSVGRSTRVVAADQGIVSSPSWSHDGRMIYYTATSSGSPQIYATPSDGSGAASPAVVTNASTGVSAPDISRSNQLAALHFKHDGYHLGFAQSPKPGVPKRTSAVGPRSACVSCRLATAVAPPLDLANVPASVPYSPWRSLLPRYWEPVIISGSGEGTAFGAATSGEDIIGRHAYFAEATFNASNNDTEGFISYQYAGFGQPYLNFFVEQQFEHFDVFSNTDVRVADLSRRARTGGVNLSFTRPRVRTFFSASIGADLESRSYSTDPDTVLSHLAPLFRETRNYPSVIAGASFSNTRRPSLSISREDGVALSASVRQRWRSGDYSNASRSVIGVAALYKSLDLPGFAHHVIAFRGAGGYADNRAISTFSVGGLSGGSLDAIAGVTLGGERRTFGVRGFPPSSEQGIRAVAGTLEYRAPVAAPSRRVPFIPVLFDRISVAAFGDAGRAFCPGSADSSAVCQLALDDAPWLASAGAEIDFDTAIQYDVPARFRLGFAVPVAGRERVGARRASVYLTVGTSF